ncbi:MAG: HEAT repeat domain-containing protein [Pseudomonadota bacterium]
MVTIFLMGCQELRSKNPSVRQRGAIRLGALNKPEVLSILIKALNDPSKIVFFAAVFALRDIGERAIPSLIKALSSHNKRIQFGAAMALGKIGERAASAVPALIVALKSRSSDVRITAAWALGKMGVSARTAVPTLVEILKRSGDPMQQSTLISALGDIGPHAAHLSLPVLSRTLNSCNRTVRIVTVASLGQMGRLAIPYLIGVLKKRDSQMKAHALISLKKAGKIAVSAIPILIRFLESREKRIKRLARNALLKIGPFNLSTLSKGLNHSTSSVRRIVSSIIAKRGEKSKSIAKMLSKPYHG